MITTLFTPRLTLRPIDLVDSGMLQRLLGDPGDCLLLGCDPFNQEGVNNRIVRQSINNKTGASCHWVIERRDLRIPIGFCDVHLPADHLRSLPFCDIAFGLDKIHRRSGYMHEALNACITHLFNSVHMRRIEASVNPANQASGQLLEKLGFQQEGIQRQKWHWSGAPQDVLAYALLASDFMPDASRKPT